MARAFADVSEAKDFLVAMIVGEAQLQGVALTDAERKMLYYSVLQKTVADSVADQFPDYDPEYERKISDLIRAAYERDPNRHDDIENAIGKLKSGDHYLLVMAREAMDSSTTTSSEGSQPRRAKDVFALFGTGLLAVVVLLTLMINWDSWKEAFWHWWSR